MSRNAFLGLCVATLLVVILTVVAVRQQPGVQASDQTGALVFPGLVHRSTGLKSIIIRSKDGELTFDWDGKTWVSRDRGGYPADEKKLEGMVVQLAQMDKIEAKTRMPDKYAALHLDDPKDKGSEAREVVLVDGNGGTLADVIVGKKKFTLGSKETGAYIRVPGDPQTWLVRADLDPGTQLKDWLDRRIADIKESDVARVTVTHPDGSKVIVEKNDATPGTFKIANLPHGQQPVSEYAGEDVARVLSDLQLDDVAPADKIVLPEDKTTTAVFDCTGGGHVTVQVAAVGGKTWLKIHAVRDSDSGHDAGKSTVDWAKVAQDINTRGQGWAFQVPDYAVAALNKPMSDFAKKPDKASKT